MKTVVILTALMLLTTMAVAQQAPAAAAPAPTASSSAVPDGTLIVVELKSKIDTKKAKVGDPVNLEVAQDAKGPDGKVVIPKKTKLTGKITESDPSSKESPDAKLSVLVTSANIKGQSVPMTGYLMPPFKAPQPMQMDMSMIGAANQRGDTGATMKEDPTAGKATGGGSDASGLAGIRLKRDDKLGTYLVSDKKNIVLESGTMFQVQQATLAPATK